MDFLQFARTILMHYLKAADDACQRPPEIIYPRKYSSKGNKEVSKNERVNAQRFVEKKNQKRCGVCPARPRTCCLVCKLGLCVNSYFKAYYTK